MGWILSFFLLSAANAGNFSKIKEIPNQDPSLYTVGCKKPGIFESKWQFDLRLKTGSLHEYRSEQMISTGARKGLHYQVETTAISNAGSQVRYNLLGLSGISYNGPKTGTVTCSLTSPSSSQCQFIPASTTEFAMIVWGNGYQFDPNYCAFEATANYTKKTYDGEFTFEDGRKVKAYQVSWVTNGNLKCRDGFQGPGQEIYSEVISNDIPARPESAEYCGGVRLQDTRIYSEGLSLKYQRTTELVSQH